MYKNIIQYEPQEYRALNNLGNWYYAKRDRANAIEMWQQAIDSNPNDPTAYTNMGVAANDEGRVEESEKLLLQAIAVDPLYYNEYYNLAILYTQQNRLPEAINTLEILQKKYPSQELISIIGDLKSNKQNKTKQTQ
jgi:tetratricopeptide (TPR) repeat protein